MPAVLAIVSHIARFIADNSLDPRKRKLVDKKHPDVKKRLDDLRPKLNSDQLAELRKVEDTWTLMKPADGLGIQITPQCDIDGVAPGSYAAVRCPNGHSDRCTSRL